jgi:hypothetical protein
MQDRDHAYVAPRPPFADAAFAAEVAAGLWR